MADALSIQNPVQSRGCRLHKHRSKTATEKHHVWPLANGGPDTSANLLEVCADGHNEVHQYIALLRFHGGVVPWKYRRLYGRKTREVAMCGWLASVFRIPYPPRL